MRDPIGLTAEVGKACKFELAFAVKKKIIKLTANYTIHSSLRSALTSRRVSVDFRA